MYQNYRLGHRIQAYILILSISLQSCLNSTLPPNEKHAHGQSFTKVQLLETDSDEQRKAPHGSIPALVSKGLIVVENKVLTNQFKATIRSSSEQQFSSVSGTIGQSARENYQKKITGMASTNTQFTPVEELVSRKSLYNFKTPQGQRVKIYQQGERWQASVKEKVGVFKGEYQQLPVYCGLGMSLEKLVSLPKSTQERYLHVSLPRPTINQVGYVYIYPMGLLGGGKDKKINKTEKEKKENVEEKENVSEKRIKKIKRSKSANKPSRKGDEEVKKVASEKRKVEKEKKEGEKKKKENAGEKREVGEKRIKKVKRSKSTNKPSRKGDEEAEKVASKRRKVKKEKKKGSEEDLDKKFRIYNAAIKALQSNSSQTEIDLSKEKRLTKEQFRVLKKAVDSNSVIGYIKWNHVPAKCQKLKEKIEKKLVQNICAYTYHPTDYVHGLLANHVYEEPKIGDEVDLCELHLEINNLPQEQTPAPLRVPTLDEVWRVRDVEDDSEESGFYSALYVNVATHQAVLSFQGTKYICQDLLREDMQGVLGNAKVTRQQKLTYKKTKAAIEYVKKHGLNLSITGHSLGGYLAELAVAYCYDAFNFREVKAIVFDSPGTDKKLETFESNVINPGTEFKMGYLPITAYLSVPNFVNSCNGHPGEVYRVFPKLKWENLAERCKKLDSWKKYLTSIPLIGEKIQTVEKGALALTGHSLVIILKEFDPLTGKPRVTGQPWNYVRVKKWPNLNTDATKHIGKEGTTGTIGSVATVIADCLNIDQTEFWNVLEYLDEGYREDALEPEEEYKLRYLGKYQEHPIKVNSHFLYKDDYRSVDWYLNELWEKRDKIARLRTNDIVIKVLKNILRNDYIIEALEDRPYIRLRSDQGDIQKLRDNMKRAIEVLTSDCIYGVLSDIELRLMTQSVKNLEQRIETLEKEEEHTARANTAVEVLNGVLRDLSNQLENTKKLMWKLSIKQGTAKLYKYNKPSYKECDEMKSEYEKLRVQLLQVKNLVARLEVLLNTSSENTIRPKIVEVLANLKHERKQLKIAKQITNALLMYMGEDLTKANKKLDTLIATLADSALKVSDLDKNLLLNRAYNLKAKIAARSEDYNASKSHYRKAMEYLLDDPMTLSNYGGLLSDIGRSEKNINLYVEAYDCYKKIRLNQIQPEQLPVVYSGMAYGFILLAQGIEKIEKGEISEIKQAELPNIVELRNRAQEFLKNAIQLNSGYLNAHVFLAILFYDQNECEMALQEIDKVLAFDPEHPVSLMYKGLIIDKLEEPDKAIVLLRQARGSFQKTKGSEGWIKEIDEKIAEIEARKVD